MALENEFLSFPDEFPFPKNPLLKNHLSGFETENKPASVGGRTERFKNVSFYNIVLFA